MGSQETQGHASGNKEYDNLMTILLLPTKIFRDDFEVGVLDMAHHIVSTETALFGRSDLSPDLALPAQIPTTFEHCFVKEISKYCDFQVRI